MSREKKNTEIDRKYKTTYTYNCPVRGMVTQEVVVTRYKAQSAPESISDNEISELLRTVVGEDIEELGFHEEET